MANCESIYYQSTNGTIQLGDFLYQNEAQTIPASEGYYANSQNGFWYETDAEGVVINLGSCLDTGVKLASSSSTAFFACTEAVGCASTLPFISFDATLTSSIVGNNLWYASSSLAFNMRATTTSGSADSASAFYPYYTGSNSWYFTGSGVTGTPDKAYRGFMRPADTVTINKLNGYFTDMFNSFVGEVWFKPQTDSNIGRKILFGKSNTSDTEIGYKFTINNSKTGSVGFQLASAVMGTQYTVNVETQQTFADNKWHHLAVIWDPSNYISGSRIVSASDAVTLIVDGKVRDKDIVQTSSFLSGSITTDIQFFIGTNDPDDTAAPDIGTNNPGFTGRIGKVKLYNVNTIPSEAYLQYQYYASSSIFNN